MDLGYLERRVFHLKYASAEAEELFNMSVKRFPDNIYTELGGFEPGTPKEFVVWDRPSRILEWEAFFVEYDNPDYKSRLGKLKSHAKQADGNQSKGSP